MPELVASGLFCTGAFRSTRHYKIIYYLHVTERTEPKTKTAGIRKQLGAIMTRQLIIILLFASTFALGQRVNKKGELEWFSNVMVHTEKEAIKYQLKYYDTINGVKCTVSRIADTVIFNYISADNKPYMTRKATFNDEIKVCDFEQFYFSCDSCTQYFVNSIVSTKTYEWKKVADNLYFSKKFWKMELELLYDKNHMCNTVIFRQSKLTKKDFLARRDRNNGA